MNQKKILSCFLLLLSLVVFLNQAFSATTGKIAGIITDKDIGEPLPGVNVIVEGTMLGAATDIDGYYTILNVPPGKHNLVIDYIGYQKTNVSDVTVRIDQTTRIDVELTTTTLTADVINVVAEFKQVQVDVSTSKTSYSDEEIKALPVNSVQSAIELQAGIQGDLQIRGSRGNESLVLVDGVTMRDPKNNAPILGVPLSAVQELAIQRGGFNAEYGQVQAGVVNMTLKEGSKNKYDFSAIFNITPPQKRYFGISPFNRNSQYMRPYLDPAVCWTGTDNGAWDTYTQKQYPKFEGWNAVSQKLMTDTSTTNDLSPKGAQQQWMWEHRRQAQTDQWDYNVDIGLGGPVPFISQDFGNLRFFTSFQRYREMLMVPLSRDDLLAWNYQFQLVSDISSSMKLRINTMFGKKYSNVRNWPDFRVTQDWSEGYFIERPWQIANEIDQNSLFSSGYFSLADITYNSFSAKLSHTINSKTYYDVSLEHLSRNYDIYAPDRFSTTANNEIIPGYYMDDRPLGFFPTDLDGLGSGSWGYHTARVKENSTASTTTLKADLNSQVSLEHLVKTGIEVVYNELDIKAGLRETTNEKAFSEANSYFATPWRFSAYVQDKIEVYGFVTNLGLRFDYSNPNTKWITGGPYSDYYGANYDPTQKYPLKQTKSQYQLSPRLGISHPITEESKLFFNYGHFKQLPRYESLMRTHREAGIEMSYIGDPNLVLAKTVAYELGFDYAFENEIVLQLAAYYKDITDRPYDIQYNGENIGAYYKLSNDAYEDIRGFEASINKKMGRWWSGFANFTYEARSYGNYGSYKVFENPSQQREFNENTSHFYQIKLIPKAYSRAHLNFFTPFDYGYDFGGIKPFADWYINMSGYWSSGDWYTYNGGDIIWNNVVENISFRFNAEGRDYWGFNLRLGKKFTFNKFDIKFFMDIYNVFNLKQLSLNSFESYEGNTDRIDYLASLHLSENEHYNNIPGDDKIGDYRQPGVAYQPIKIRGFIDINAPDAFTWEEGVIYWSRDNETYYEMVNGIKQVVPQSKMKKILDNKAYIDMPNKTSFTFLEPRRISFGINISYSF